ncbi:MAG TPA: DUF1801 domain-containing protein [Anaerolineaceae bacterium]|nr:DUF1801 domain-containing protein [Anaerolineaceae bacterium]HPN52595.1 DUF1801 domain-containing protein [Anaerolineaceae bacterium]
MDPDPENPQAIDDYIARYPEEIRAILQKIRAIIREIAPDASEAMKYRLPTFVLNGNLVHFGAFKHHIGFYPAPAGIEAFVGKLAPYQQSKGAIQFPLNQPIPYDLIAEIVAFRTTQNREKAAAPKSKKPTSS